MAARKMMKIAIDRHGNKTRIKIKRESALFSKSETESILNALAESQSLSLSLRPSREPSSFGAFYVLDSRQSRKLLRHWKERDRP
jgi:hypothetical protein